MKRQYFAASAFAFLILCGVDVQAAQKRGRDEDGNRSRSRSGSRSPSSKRQKTAVEDVQAQIVEQTEQVIAENKQAVIAMVGNIIGSIEQTAENIKAIDNEMLDEMKRAAVVEEFNILQEMILTYNEIKFPLNTIGQVSLETKESVRLALVALLVAVQTKIASMSWNRQDNYQNSQFTQVGHVFARIIEDTFGFTKKDMKVPTQDNQFGDDAEEAAQQDQSASSSATISNTSSSSTTSTTTNNDGLEIDDVEAQSDDSADDQ